MPTASDADANHHADRAARAEVRRAHKAGQIYIRTLAKASLHFGLPTNRLDTNLRRVADELGQAADFVSLPGAVVSTFKDLGTGDEDTEVIAGDGHCTLSAAGQVLAIARAVMRGQRPEEGTRRLRQLMRAPPLYNTFWLCIFSFFCSACFSLLEFGGSPIDSLVAGAMSAVLRFVTLKMHKLETSSIVFELTMIFIISLGSRALSTVNNLFCYSAVSSAAIVFALPGYIVLIAALEIANEKIIVGASRMVTSLVYTLFLGYALTMGSELFLGLDDPARRSLSRIVGEIASPRDVSATWRGENGRETLMTMRMMNTVDASDFVIEGCFRSPFWPWWRQPMAIIVQQLPDPGKGWMIAAGLAILLSAFKSLAHQQDWRSTRFLGMIVISFATWSVSGFVKVNMDNNSFLVSLISGTVVGFTTPLWAWACLHQYDAFTISVTPVLFLVPVALSEGDAGLAAAGTESGGRQPGAVLAIRMLQVVWGIALGVMVGQWLTDVPIRWSRTWWARRRGRRGRSRLYRARL